MDKELKERDFDLIRRKLEAADLYFVTPFEELELPDKEISCCMMDATACFFEEPKSASAKAVINPELEERLQSLLAEIHEEGVPLDVIHEWLNTHVHLSRLMITDRNKILLTDFGNLEIKMGPLPKTVFFFYLKHPEGVDYTSLMDYRDELMEIYSHITAYDDTRKVQDSIDRLINPFDNSISEKCSAVRFAFLKVLDSSVAEHYCIHGKQGERRYIQLDRKLVTWKTGF